MTEQLPPSTRKLSRDESIALEKKFDYLIEIRPAHSPGSTAHGVYWPKTILQSRAVPEGILPLDHEDGYDHDVKLESFIKRHAPDGVAFWGPELEEYKFLYGPYNKSTRIWIKQNIISATSCLILINKNIVLLANEPLSFTVIGAPDNLIIDLEEEFGGAAKLRSNFVDHVDRLDLGFGKSDRDWAKKFVIPWCGW